MDILNLNVFVCLIIKLTSAYKPVFIVHGILSENITMIKLGEIIRKYHPGTRVYILSQYCGWESLISLMHQVQEAGPVIVQASALNPEGLHLIGYSQGGLLSRAILQAFPEHRVHTFISLSSPQAGQYGTQMIRTLYPHLVKKDVYKLFYSRVGQHLSVGNYWNDPHHQNFYYEYNKFLPVFNNEVPNPKNITFKKGITKLKRMVLLGGPDDEVIAPWQSSHFGFFDKTENVTRMEERNIYKDDLFGLKTLDERGNLNVRTISGVHHHFWYRNISVIKKFILPYLD